MSGSALGRRNALDDGFENVGDALSGFGADEDGVGGVEADGAFDHFLRARDVGGGQIDLVDDGNDFEAVVDGEIGVGEGLRFDALGGVDDQQRAFAGGERARDFVGEIDVAGRVDQVELVGLAVLRGVHHADGVGLDGDAALAFEVHGVEHLGLHFAGGEGSGELEQAVGERGFAVVDVGDDREIADEGAVHGWEVIFDFSREWRGVTCEWRGRSKDFNREGRGERPRRSRRKSIARRSLKNGETSGPAVSRVESCTVKGRDEHAQTGFGSS